MTPPQACSFKASFCMVGGLQPPPVEEEEAIQRATGQGVIFVLEQAQLEVAQVGKVGELLVWGRVLVRASS